MDEKTEVASPTEKSGDDQNVSSSQAAALLFAQELKAAQPATKPGEKEEQTKDESAQPTPETTEAEQASAETETQPAEPESAPMPEPGEETEEETKGEEEQDVHSKKPNRLEDEFQKRLNREVSKRKALEERIAEIDQQLKQATVKAEAAKPLPKGNLPLAEVNDVPSLDKKVQEAKEARRWAEKHLEDLPEEGFKVGEEVFDRTRLRHIRDQATVIIEDHAPARERFLRARDQASQQARNLFPFLADSKHEDFQLAVAAYQANPWLQDLPNADFIVGVQVEGIKALKARQTAANTKKETKEEKPKPKIPATRPAGDQGVVSSGASTGRVPTSTAARTAFANEREKVASKGSVTAAEAAMLLQRSAQLRNSK